jgi:hypothetical protein
LRGIDLAEIEHMSLHHTTVVEPPVLDDAPVEMRLSVLPAFGLSQKHGAKILPCQSESGNPLRV